MPGRHLVIKDSIPKKALFGVSRNNHLATITSSERTVASAEIQLTLGVLAVLGGRRQFQHPFQRLESLQAQGFSNDDRAFAAALIKELRYFDTARRWLAEKRSARTTKPEQQAEIDSLLIDILQAEGKGNEAIEALAEFKKKWPTHPRAALGSLEKVGSEFAKVLGKLEDSKKARDADSAKADQLVSEANSDFKAQVQKPLDLLIEDLFKQAKAAKGNEKLSKIRLAYQAELARVNIFLVYARSLGEGEVHDSYLERGLKLADHFVSERDEFYIMRYEAQIQKGLYLYEMKRYAESAEELELIFDIEPFARPPYSPQLLKAFHTIRLKAYLFSAKAYNAAKKPGIAVSILKPIMRSTAVPGDPFAPAIGLVESDSDLQQFAVLARLEYGIAMADAGDAAAGMSTIHKVISKYDQLHKETKVDKYRAFVIDARKALGRVSSSGSAALSGRDYYQAAIGLKSELKLEEALRAFQTALAKLSASEVAEYAPICLNEIGELSFILKRYDEAAVAFSELADQHSESEIFRKKAATSFAASVDKAKRELGKAAASHAGYAESSQYRGDVIPGVVQRHDDCNHPHDGADSAAKNGQQGVIEVVFGILEVRCHVLVQHGFEQLAYERSSNKGNQDRKESVYPSVHSRIIREVEILEPKPSSGQSTAEDQWFLQGLEQNVIKLGLCFLGQSLEVLLDEPIDGASHDDAT